MQTPILYRLTQGNSGRIGRFFAVGAFIAVSLLSTLFPTGSVSAASYIPGGAKFTWVNEARIEATGPFVATFTDSNAYDLDRTFKATVTQALADNYKKNCTNYNGDRRELYKIIPISATRGTLYEVEHRNSKGECKMLSKEINLQSPDKAQLQALPCPYTGSTAEERCAERNSISNATWIRTCPGMMGPFAPGTVCSTTPKPEVPAPATPGPTNSDGNAPSPCDSLGDFDFRWIACPLLTAGTEAAKAMDDLIESQLHYDTDIFDTSTEGGKGFYAAWSTFRSIALALVLIVGLVMVVSQGTGMQLFDAYTVRKVMPRLLIAVIGITLSWPILHFVLTFFNDIGHGLQDLMLLPFQKAAHTTEAAFEGNTSIGSVLSVAVAGAGAYAYIATMGPLAVMSLLGTALLALLVAVLVVLIRSVVITACIIFAPLAIACYILPNTKKVWDFWQNALTTALMIFPLIMLLIGAGKAMAYISTNGILKVLFLLLPYFFLPFAFKLAGGLMSTIFSLANDRGKGGFDRLRNFRDNEKKKRVQDAIEGRGNYKMLGGGRGVAGAPGRALAGMYRRSHVAGQVGGGYFGARYQAANQKFMAGVTAKMLDDDHGRAAGDDNATAIGIQEGMTSKEFIRQYRARTGVDEATANAALKTLETGFGARVGTSAMRVAAYKALAASTTGYGAGDYEQMTRDGVSLMQAGFMNAADAAAALKANKQRADISGVGFGTWINTMVTGQQRLQAGAGNLVVDRKALARDALNGSQPGMIVGGRHEAVTALAPIMLEDLQTKYQAMLSAQSNPQLAQADKDRIRNEFTAELAATAGRYDVMAQISPKSAGIMSQEVLSKRIGAINPATGQAMNVQEMIEQYRVTDPHFVTLRREYGNQAGIQAMQAQQAQQAAGPGPGAGMGPPGGGLMGPP